jgi:hypothetical protein
MGESVTVIASPHFIRLIVRQTDSRTALPYGQALPAEPRLGRLVESSRRTAVFDGHAGSLIRYPLDGAEPGDERINIIPLHRQAESSNAGFPRANDQIRILAPSSNLPPTLLHGLDC